MDRTTKQYEIVCKDWWPDMNGIVEAATGFGKSRTAMVAGQLLVQKRNIQSIIVVVPLVRLKEQWETGLKKMGLDKISTVYVVNTASTLNLSCDYLILDEMHTLAAPQWRKVMTNIKYKYLMGLTATLQRQDGEHTILTDLCPVIAQVPLEMCKAEGWVSDFAVYNLAVPFTGSEAKQYKKYNSAFNYAAMLCSQVDRDTFKVATMWLKNGTKEEKGIAARYYNSMRKRRSICLSAVNKLSTTKAIMDMFPDRQALIFSQEIEFADQLQELLGDTCVTFHSKMKKKDKDAALKRFKDKRTKVRGVSSVKGLAVGIDVPDCSLGIITSGTGSERDGVQITGRMIRKQPDKYALVINLYVPDTQDEVWTRKRTQSQNPIWITKLEEIV